MGLTQWASKLQIPLYSLFSIKLRTGTGAAGTGPFPSTPNPRATPSGCHQNFFVDGKARPGVREPNEGVTITHRGGSVSLWPSKHRQKQAVTSARPGSQTTLLRLWLGAVMWPWHIPAHQCQSDLENTGDRSRGSSRSLASVECLPVVHRLVVGTLLPSSDTACPMALVLWPKWLLRRRRRKQKHLLMTPAFITSLARQHMIIFPAGWWLVAQAVLLTLVRAVSQEVSKAPASTKGSKCSCMGRNSTDQTEMSSASSWNEHQK